MSQDKSGDDLQEVPVVNVSSENHPEPTSKSIFHSNSGKSLATHTMEKTIEEGQKYLDAQGRQSEPVGVSTRKKSESKMKTSEKKPKGSESKREKMSNKIDRQTEAQKSTKSKAMHRTATMEACIE